jgi:molybdopterin-guanine dinucleotide biosynthesis protein A
MICALLLGREGSRSFPGKNVYPILGRPMMAYPLLAANASKYIDAVYVSTDSPKISEIGRGYGAKIIDRPDELCTPDALGEDAYAHGHQVIREALATEAKTIELMVLLFCNAPTITGELIDRGIDALRANPEYDSAVTTSIYNMWSPLRARKLDAGGLLEPFVPFEIFGDPTTLNCDRDSQGNVHFADMGVSIVRPHCLVHLDEGLLPQKWMGKRIYPIENWGGCDVDYEWQVPQVEFWLKAQGYSEAV